MSVQPTVLEDGTMPRLGVASFVLVILSQSKWTCHRTFCPGNKNYWKIGLLDIICNIFWWINQQLVTPISAILTAATGVTPWSWGHRRFLGVVTGSQRFFMNVIRVTESG